MMPVFQSYAVKCSFPFPMILSLLSIIKKTKSITLKKLHQVCFRLNLRQFNQWLRYITSDAKFKPSAKIYNLWPFPPLVLWYDRWHLGVVTAFLFIQKATAQKIYINMSNYQITALCGTISAGKINDWSNLSTCQQNYLEKPSDSCICSWNYTKEHSCTIWMIKN